ncbi:pseudouridine synthase [Anaeromyxobacter dehalogenans 2CP-1]|uniref:Pseudouridine synthase n=1 Tax=Anaeromyxobacter dehalogenans (strain ATCC BAA-258 / DSM 21875 / 2CP-1) TaxID=455488 RepID=B8J8C2_ANAD2|nr:RluA family pseudouridine synthase [Anaeromyxobacter dehalogenans]ACL65421.1 pseudouridine synthase [Anaeromyxobacter dehalogenans 2CP-1]
MTAGVAAPVTVLHEDAHLLAVDKPAGRLVIPGRDGGEPSLREELEARFGRLWVVHRLDRNTSGVLVLARTAAAHRTLNLAFDRGEPRKRYLALVRGVPPAEQRIEVAIAPGRKGRMRAAAPDDPRGKASATVVRRLDAFPRHPLGGGPLALVEALPETGRTHQIRVHLAAAGTPLAVDPAYGDAAPLLGPGGEAVLARTPLHAARLALRHPADGRELVLEAPLPADLAGTLALLRGAPGGA